MMTDDGQSVAKLKLATQRKSRLPSEQRGWSTTRRVAQEHDYPTTISGKKDPPISSSKNKLKTLSWKEWRKLERDRKEKEEDEQTLAKVEAPIPQSNIRFKLLKQMGYMPGAALGKKGLGRAEPVGIEIRRLRAGHWPSGVGGMLAGGSAAVAAMYGAHHLTHGHYGHHHGFFGHGKLKNGKFGKRWKHGMFKRWK
ncbi:hypothetical protein HN51_015740 [Arachis hypogaea]